MNWTHPTFDDLSRLLSSRTGLTFEPDRRASAELGIRRAMAKAKVTDPVAYLALIETNQSATDDLIAELTIGETYFFREPGQFEFIRRTVLPEVRERRGPTHSFRAWSAACASGEEAYSLAILFAEEGLDARTHLLATDISRTSLLKVKEATYGAWSLRGESAEYARPYLKPKGERFVVDDAIRRRVTFEYLNLALDVYPSFSSGTWGMDLILCRNVLIYLDRETIRAVAGRLYASLAEGGWLITASSDPPLATEAPLETVVTEQGIFYRRLARPIARSAEPAADSDRAATTRSTANHSTPPSRAESESARSKRSNTSLAPLAPKEKEIPRLPVREQAGGGLPAPERTKADHLVEAQRDFDQGDYAGAIARTRGLTEDAAASALHVRALANVNTTEAEQACSLATSQHPLSSELHYLRAVLLLDLGRDADAGESARRAIYLDRSLAIVHFTLGSILSRLGDVAGASRAYRNARDLCAARPTDEVVPLSDGEPAGRLTVAAQVQMDMLEVPQERRR